MTDLVRSAFAFSVFLAMTAGLSATGSAQQAPSNRPPPAVVVRSVTAEPSEPPVEDIGRVEALESVDIRARVQGFIDTVDFQPGAAVKAGDPLFVIEPARYEAAVAAAKAQLARAVATRQQATISRDRNAELVRRSAVARAAYDDAQAALDVAEADVAAAQANLSKADLDLSYTRIAAPISGRIGQALFTQGNLVGTDSGPIARIVQVDPLRVTFSVTEGELTTWRQRRIADAAAGNEPIRLTLILPNGTAYAPEGRIEFLAPEIDARTGTAGVRALFPNPDGLLMPGQFVKVVTSRKDVAMSPAVAQSAVMQDRDGRFVYILDAGNVVHQRRIETGAKIGDLWVVRDGVAAGEKVVVQGMQRLSDGLGVRPVAEDAAGGSEP